MQLFWEINMPAKFYFKVKTQYENLGDALINRELISEISKKGELTLDLTGTPSKFKENILPDSKSVIISKSILSFYFKMIKEAIFSKENVYYFLNPGGYGGEVSKKTLVKMNVNYLVMRLLTLIGIKICRVGVSYTQLGRRHSSVIQKMADIFHYHSVRDAISEAYCNEIGIRIGNVIPDMAFNLSVEEGEKEKSIDYLISFRRFSDNKIADVFESKLKRSFINKEELCVRLAFQVQFDQDYQEHLANVIGSKLKILNMSNSLNGNVFTYSGVKYVVSNRLHVLLLALSAGAIPVAVIDRAENKKIVGVFENSGLDCLIFDACNFSLDKISKIKIDIFQCRKIFNDKAVEIDSFFSGLS
jgi:polysaccharide pyruvyl transferase WcaK-like protein